MVVGAASILVSLPTIRQRFPAASERNAFAIPVTWSQPAIALNALWLLLRDSVLAIIETAVFLEMEAVVARLRQISVAVPANAYRFR